MGKQNLYKILITGTPISGKTNTAKKLENNLIDKGLKVSNKDIDYDKNWREIPSYIDVYILQTPHGSEAEEKDGIQFKNFNKIIYMNPTSKTIKEFLASRGTAWFKEGVVELPCDNPQPYSTDLLPRIIKRILNYAYNIPELIKKDKIYFQKEGIEINTIVPFFEEEEIKFRNYQEIFYKILNEVNSNY